MDKREFLDLGDFYLPYIFVMVFFPSAYVFLLVFGMNFPILSWIALIYMVVIALIYMRRHKFYRKYPAYKESRGLYFAESLLAFLCISFLVVALPLGLTRGTQLEDWTGSRVPEFMRVLFGFEMVALLIVSAVIAERIRKKYRAECVRRKKEQQAGIAEFLESTQESLTDIDRNRGSGQ
ncbi:MAG: hypothetical protein FWD76_05230 [Firmicutes bacterium]|nr:hypothetical protein [Bacillota bacterium]